MRLSTPFLKNKFFWWICFFSLLSSALEFVLPFLAQTSLDQVLPLGSFHILLLFSGGVGIFYVIQWILGGFFSYLNQLTTLNLTKEIKRIAFGKKLDCFEFSKVNPTSSDLLITIDQDASYWVQGIIKSLDLFCRSLILLIGSHFFIAWKDPILLLILWIYVLCEISKNYFFSPRQAQKAEEMRNFKSHFSHFLMDTLSKIKIIHLFQCQDFFKKKFDLYQDQQIQLEKSYFWIRKGEGMIGGAFSFIFKLGIATYLGRELMLKNLTSGETAFLLLLLPKFQGGLIQLCTFFREFQSLKASTKQLHRILEESQIEMKPLKKIDHFESLSFQDVCFQWDSDHPLFQNFSFEIRKGEKAVIYGPSGSGKTTLFHLILGLLKPKSGKILLNGFPLLSYDLSSWYSLLGMIPPENELFDLDLKENMALGRTFSGLSYDLKLEKKFLQAGLDSLAPKDHENSREKKNPKSNENFSAGEVRRILLARALYQNPPVLLCDEPDAHLDEKTALEIFDPFFSAQDKTLILFTHRGALIQKAEKKIRI